MQTAKQAAQQALAARQQCNASSTAPQPTSDNSTNLRRQRAMARLWSRMAELWGGLWASQAGEVGGQVFGTWLNGLADVAEGQIRHALNELMTSGRQYPPNLVEFRGLCQCPEALGLPDEAAAIDEIMRARRIGSGDHPWSHPVVYHLNAEVGYELRTMGADAWERKFKAAYGRWLKRIRAGESVPPIPLALPAPELPPPAEAYAARLGVDLSRPQSPLAQRLLALRGQRQEVGHG